MKLKFLDNLSVRWKLLLAVIVPCIAMVGFAAEFMYQKYDRARTMAALEEVSAFSMVASEVIHELQRERGRSAGFVGSKGALSYKTGLQTQRSRTDQAIKALRDEIATHRSMFVTVDQKTHLAKLQTELSDLIGHRREVDKLVLNLPQAVGPYTQTINNLITLVVDNSRTTGAKESASTMTAILALMRAKESAGLERAVGSNIFASGELTQQKHMKAVDLIARQEGYFAEFGDVASDEWDKRLAELHDSDVSKAVFEARKVLINAAYGGKLEGYTGTDWFELTTKRIDALKSLEFALVEHLRGLTLKEKQAAEFSVGFAMALSLAVLVISILVSVVMIRNVLMPIIKISDCLDRLSQGETNIEIGYGGRGDEIGILANAAQNFQSVTAQREMLMEHSTRQEKQAMAERRRVLTQMATEVEDATHQSVARVISLADTLTEHVMNMQKSMDDVSRTAGDTNSSTAKSLDDTKQASDLASELSAAISEVAQNVVNGDRLARETIVLADESKANVEALDEATQQINDFVGIISELADQTNLLALNATIESARAGEAGRGFAVVASEIKQLAAQTTRSASEITERVNKIQGSTQDAVSSINRITSSISSIGEMTSSISAAVEQQRVSTANFAEFLGSNRSTIETVATRINDLNEIAMRVTERSRQITEQVAEMAEVSREADRSIPNIIKRAVDAADNRREDRMDSDASVVLASGNVHTPTKLKDISEHGARVDVWSDGPVTMTLPDNMGEVSARTAWSSDTESGLEFDKPLDNSLVGRLIAQKEREAKKIA